ncbi:MAG: hypothetical protein P1T08_01680 [Acidimicrobiia bacterium]|nr:hypothetical protein [Acidimicrobiia bacterium]
MWKHRPALIIFCLAILGACSQSDPLMHGEDALPSSIGNLSGTYVLNGIDPLGNEYTGHLEVSDTERIGIYDLQWIVTEAFQLGTGRLDGNLLEVEWRTSDQAAQEVSGTATFTVTVDGELYGSKHVDGDDGEWRETAYPAGRESRVPGREFLVAGR